MYGVNQNAYACIIIVEGLQALWDKSTGPRVVKSSISLRLICYVDPTYVIQERFRSNKQIIEGDTQPFRNCEAKRH